MGKERDAFRVLLLSVMGELGPQTLEVGADFLGPVSFCPPASAVRGPLTPQHSCLSFFTSHPYRDF